MSKIVDAMKEAVDIASGKIPAARLFHGGYWYVPESSLPLHGPPRPMSTAPKDGTRILVYAELAADHPINAFNGMVIVAWDKLWNRWELSPRGLFRIDSELSGWWPLPEVRQ